MRPKNYSQNNKNKSGGHDTLGIVLIIVFSFLLLCALTGSLILGDIGLVVKNISVGLLGYFAYPVFLYCIIRGIFLLQNKAPAVRIRNIVSLIAIFFCAGIIIHLATTSAYISDFGTYIDKVFHGTTVGGVLMGLFAYALAACLTDIGTYILLGCIIIFLLLLTAGFFDKGFSCGKSSGKKSAVSQTPRIKGGTTFVGDGGDLFIESIIPPDAGVSAPGTFDELPDQSEMYAAERKSYSPGEETYSPEIEKMRRQQDERFDEIYKRSRAHQILFNQGNPDDGKNDGNDGGQYGYDNYSGYSSGKQSSGGYSGAKSSSSNKGWDDLIVMPPPKNISSRFVSGSIINGDTVGPVRRTESRYDDVRMGDNYPRGTQSANASEGGRFDFDALKKSVYDEAYGSYAEERKRYETQNPQKPDIRIVSSDNGDDEDMYTLPDPVQPTAPPVTPGRAPIINGDSTQPEEEETADFIPYGDKKQPEAQRPPIIIASAVMADEPYVNGEDSRQPPQQPKVNPAPIIRASRFDEDVAAQKKSDVQIRPSAPPVATEHKENSKPESAQSSALSDARRTEKTDDSLNIPDVAADKENAAVAPQTNAASRQANALPQEEEPSENVVQNDQSLYSYRDETPSHAEHIENADDADSEESGDENYAEIYGHPKFADVTKEEAEKLSESFDKNTRSFNISEEVEDASENIVQGVALPAENFHGDTKKADEVLPKEEKKPKKPYKYTPPSIELLTTESTIPQINPEVYEEKKALLEETLAELGIPATVLGITVGPTVTRFELNMPTGMSVRKIENCEQDIRYGLACKGKIRIESPIPGKKAVGIEVPNDDNALVALKDIIESKEFKASTSPLTVALGKDIQGRVMVARIDKMPHLLIAGTTGSGKSACLNSLIISLLFKSSPEDVKLILVDPKRVEFTAYSGLPHMMVPDAVTEAPQAINAFKWAREEMERRYKLLQSNRVRNITEYNNLDDVKNRVVEKMPYIVVIVDEFADLMIGSGTDKKRELENLISSIAGKARAAGIHLILATQRPSAEVITGTIKSNLPCRISFAVSNQTNSRIILDKVGAESLLGKGDMLYAPQENPDGIRIQGAFIETQEVIDIVEQIKANNQADFNKEFEKALVEQKEENSEDEAEDNDNLGDAGYDKDLPDIVRMVVKTGQASGAMIQRRFSIGYMRAAKIMDQMEKFNFIGPHNGSKPREVYITKEKFKEFFGEDFDED